MRASLAAAALLLSLPAAAQPPARNPDVAAMLDAIRAESIEARLRKLVSFHTRHTLSRTDSETVGLGAARRWIKAELDDCARASGGRLQVSLDSFTQPAGARVPQPAEIVNVVATLPGNQNRIYVVSGHYDSRAGDVMDAQSAAPGANDDASGVAAVMEAARVLSKHKFPDPRLRRPLR